MLRYVDGFIMRLRCDAVRCGILTTTTQGYVLIEYPTQSEASAAISALHGTKLLEQTIHVDYAFVRPPTKEKGRGGGGKQGGRNRGGRSRSRSRSKARDTSKSRSRSRSRDRSRSRERKSRSPDERMD